MSSSAKKTIYAAMVANFAIAIIKFIAASITGSSAMLSEGIHSVVDTGNELLLLCGHLLGNIYLNRVASIVIGVILSRVALLLAVESKGLLIGEGATAETVASIREIINNDRR
jgi:divalent metal cation (Fe/Co/Zn/Cd) transporter